MPDSMPTISHEEVARHNGSKSLWIIIHNDVYDLTKFLNEHPGGKQPILDFSGKDATQAFEFVRHSAHARTLMCKYKIGTLPLKEQSSHHNVCLGIKPGVPAPDGSDNFAWKPDDIMVYQVSSLTQLPKSKSKDTPPRSHSDCDREQPRTQGRVNTIVVPIESNKRSYNWKLIMLLLATALAAGFAWKKYKS